ncbi:hypothetical protein PENARI_c221G11843, partial [Penicillium arizonense]
MHIFIITIKELFTLLQTVPSVLGTNLWALGVLLLLGASKTPAPHIAANRGYDS